MLVRARNFVAVSCISVACGNQESADSGTNTIIGGPEADWTVIEQSLPIRQNVFRIEVDGKFLGTGFVIGPESKRLTTAAHVAGRIKYCKAFYGDCTSIRAIGSAGEMELGSVVVFDKKLDFSQVEFSWKRKDATPVTMAVSEEIPTSGPISLAGFLDDGSLVRSPGKLNGAAISRSEKPSLMYDADSLPGMSGSPVFDGNGVLVALHWGNCDDGTCNQAIPFKLVTDKYGTSTFL